MSWKQTASHGELSQSRALKDCSISVPSGERTLTDLSPVSHTIIQPSNAIVSEKGELRVLLLMHPVNSPLILKQITLPEATTMTSPEWVNASEVIFFSLIAAGPF